MSKLNDALKELKFTDDEITSIIEAVNKSEQYIPKSRFDEINEKKKEFEAQITERDKQLKELEKSVGENEELKKQIADFKKENEKISKQADEKIATFVKKQNCMNAILDKAQDAELVMGLVDLGKIVFDGNKPVGGLNEQIEAIKASKPFLFKTEQQQAGAYQGFVPQGSQGQQQQPTQTDASVDYVNALFGNNGDQNK